MPPRRSRPQTRLAVLTRLPERLNFMHAPPILFLTACSRLGIIAGCTYRSFCRRGLATLPFLSGHVPASSRRSFLRRKVDLHTTQHPRQGFSQYVSMSKAQESTSNQLVDNEAMIAKGKLISQRLEEVYPKAPEGFLHHADAYTLLISVVLSAQSLDVKVNEITPKLFKIAGTPQEMRELGEDKIRQIIKQIGLAPQKAKNIAKLSHMICEQFNGEVPDTFEGLESLPGVGHKTASVVMMQAFNKPAFPVDTHIHRLACRWGCGDAKSVKKTEAALKMWFPDPSTWGSLHTRIILFGREYCPSRKHDMDQCPICSFAATDEARKMNSENPNKFVAPISHENPYSIRDVPKVYPSDKDPSYSPVEISPGPRKKRTKTKRRAAENEEENDSGAEKGTMNHEGENDAESEDREWIIEIEAPAKRPRRVGRGKLVAVKRNEDTTVKKPAKRGGRRKKEVENSKNTELFQASGEVPRRSSRVRARKEFGER